RHPARRDRGPGARAPSRPGAAGCEGPVRRHAGELSVRLHRGSPPMTPPLPSSTLDLHGRAEEAAAAIPASGIDPRRIAVVLGSGLNELAARLPDAVTIPYDRIPHFPRPTVPGHRGKVIVGNLHGVSVLMLQGRFHYYEGHDLETVTFPVRVLQRL